MKKNGKEHFLEDYSFALRTIADNSLLRFSIICFRQSAIMGLKYGLLSFYTIMNDKICEFLVNRRTYLRFKRDVGRAKDLMNREYINK